MKTYIQILVVAFSVVSVGCGTIKEVYKPVTAGNLEDGFSDGSVKVTLVPSKSRIKIGEPISMMITIKNIGENPITIPDESGADLTWIYPDGRRDMVVKDLPVNRGAKSMVIAPGEQVVYNPTLKTGYFKKMGVTEFRASVAASHADERGVGMQLANISRAVSNGFGIEVER